MKKGGFSRGTDAHGRRFLQRALAGIAALATAYSLITPASTVDTEEAGDILGENTAEVTEEVTEAVPEVVPAEEEQPEVTEEVPPQEEEEPEAVPEEEEILPAEEETAEEETAAETEEEEPQEETEEEESVVDVYRFEDENVIVTAVLNDPAQIPDDAEFVVTQLTPQTPEYNYDAYIDALNEKGTDSEYSQENTLLYDIAFLVEKEEGSGVYEEIQPTEGAVAINFQFRQKQLSEELNVEDASAVEVKHLPLNDNVIENVDTTADAVAISSDDIRVEDVIADVNLDDVAEDVVTFETESLSVYAFRTNEGQKNFWPGRTKYTTDDLMSMLGQATDFAVVARQLISYTHIEGNIAVQNYTTDGTSGNLNEGARLYSGNKVVRITVQKTIKNGADGTFRYGVFISPSDTQTESAAIHTFEITTSGGSGTYVMTPATVPAVFTTLDSRPVYVYELDGSGKVMTDGGSVTAGGHAYTVKYNTGNQINNTDLDNYIGYMDLEHDQTINYGYFGPEGTMTYFGSGYKDPQPGVNESTVYHTPEHTLTILGKGQWTTPTNPYITTSDAVIPMIELQMQNLAAASSQLANAANGPSTEYRGLNVVNLISTTGNLTGDFDNANFEQVSAQGQSYYRGYGISGMLKDPEDDSQYLLINIDATGFDTYTLTQLKIDGYTPDSDNQFSRLSSHVIYNIVQKDASGNFVPYTGIVTNPSDVVGGTILAPGATIQQRGGMFGEVIANVVDRTNASGEIHKKTVNSVDKEVTMSVENIGEDTSVTVPFEAEKAFVGRELADQDGFAFTLKAEGNAPMPPGAQGGSLTVLANKRNNLKAAFGSAEYTAAGTYRYTITEERGGTSYNGIYYDPAVYDVVVTVTNNSGTLTAEKTITKRGGSTAQAAVFTNTYSAYGSLQMWTRKQLQGKPLKDQQFEFELYAADSSWNRGDLIDTKANDSGGNVTFNTQYFTKDQEQDDTGTKYYVIVEKITDAKTGYVYDTHEEHVTAVITDTGTGTLDVKETYTRDNGRRENVFINTYDASGEAELKVNKKLTEGEEGEELDLPDGIFTFVLRDSEGNEIARVLNRAQDGYNVTFPIQNYGLSDAGRTFTYTIEEVIPPNAVDSVTGKQYSQATEQEKKNGTWKLNGITYDNHVITATVAVAEDNDTGVLDTEVTYAGTPDREFINEYEAEGNVVLGALKTVNGDAPKTGEAFTFILSEADSSFGNEKELERTANDGSLVVFKEIKYTEDDMVDDEGHTVTEKDFYYTIKEVNEGKRGYIYDANVTHVRVHVTDDGHGNLTPEIFYSDETGNAFNNTYDATNHIQFRADKILEGRPLRTGEFAFTLEYPDGTVVTKENDADGNVVFDQINYGLKDAGQTFTYVIHEVIPAGAEYDSASSMYVKDGYHYDPTVRTIKVTLTDNRDNGTLDMDITDESGRKLTPDQDGAVNAVSFTNEYEAEGRFVPEARKQLNGGNPPADLFSFTLSKDGENETKTNLANGRVIFDEIIYTLEDLKDDNGEYVAEKTFTYTIKENIPAGAEDNGDGTYSKDGYTYDGHECTLTVTVTDDGDGTLEVKTAYTPETEGNIFKNTYRAQGELEITARKGLNDKVPEDGMFAFNLYELDPTSGAEDITDLQPVNETPVVNVGSAVNFPKIIYTSDDPTEEEREAGAVYRTNVRGNESYIYVVAEVIPEDAVSRDDPDLQYKDATRAEQTSGMWIKEGIAYDGHLYVMLAMLHDNGDGTIDVNTMADDYDAYFSNTYEAEGTAELKAKKFIDYAGTLTPVNVKGAFTFELTALNNAPLPANTTAGNDTDSIAYFDAITYTLADAGKTYQYLISEVIPGEAVNNAGTKYSEASDAEKASGPWKLNGITYDNHSSVVTVKVTDNKDGTLSTEVEYQDGEITSVEGSRFINEYEASGSISLGARKDLSGKPLEEGKFTFRLRNEAGGLIEEKSNASDGTVTFSEIKYELEDAGRTFTYTIEEVIPDDAVDPATGLRYSAASADEKKNGTWKKDGYTYSSKILIVDVRVENIGEGKLEATATYHPDDLTFVNTYEAVGTTDFMAFKQLAKKELQEGQFSFVITSTDGGRLPEETTVTNDAEGNAYFGGVEYTLEDLRGETTAEYHYEIREVIPAAAVENEDGTYTWRGYTYDGHVSHVTVRLEDTDKGIINVTRIYEDEDEEQAVFSNAYDAEGDAYVATEKVVSYIARDDIEEPFVFILKDSDGSEIQRRETTGGTVAFDRIKYTLEDLKNEDGTYAAEKTFTYTIEEVIPEGAEKKIINDKEYWFKNGIQYDDNVVTATVNVRDTGTGILATRTEYSGKNQLEFFDNMYNPEGSFQPKARKILNAPALNDKAFSFILFTLNINPYTHEPTGGFSDLETRTVTGGGAVEFDERHVSGYREIGATITYLIREDIPDEAVNADGLKYGDAGDQEKLAGGIWKLDGVVYDGTIYQYSVTFTDDKKGRLIAEESYSIYSTKEAADEAAFTNDYEAEGKAVLEVEKKLNGNPPEAGMFAFDLSAETAGAPLPETTTARNDAEGKAVFDEIRFTYADVGKTYVYVMKEAIPDDAVLKTAAGTDETKKYADATDAEKQNNNWYYAGYTFDGHWYRASVEVSDNGDGTLDAAVTYSGSGIFNNEFEATGDVYLYMYKTLNGAAPTGHMFTFVLDETTEDAEEPEHQEKTTDSTFISFDKITLDLSADGEEKTYTYELYEKIPADAKDNGDGTFSKDGYTYDGRHITATVEAKVVGENVETTVTYELSGTAVDAPTLTNQYEAVGEVDFRASKTVNGGIPEADKFTFTLSDEKGAVLQTKKNDAEGIAVFDEISYAYSDVGRTFTYTVKEVVPADAINSAGTSYANASAEEKKTGVFVKEGMSYSEQEKTITVEVRDDIHDGELEITVRGGSENDLVFANTYEAVGKTDFEAFKELTGKTLEEGRFSFTITSEDGRLPEETTVTNGAGGRAVFGEVTYDLSDAGKTYVYEIKEVIPQGAKDNQDGTFTLNGYVYDGHTAQVTVTITDNKDGTLKVEKTMAADANVFRNRYEAEGEYTPSVSKQLVGIGFGETDPKIFRFELLDSANRVIDTAETESAAVSFSTIVYTEADAGREFRYTIREVPPEGAVMQPDGSYLYKGITYDRHIVTLTVNVRDDGEGTLNAEGVYSEANPTFINVYNAEGQTNVTVHKQLIGKKLAPGAFGFIMTADTENAPLPEQTVVVNDADGNISFGDIHYTLADLGGAVSKDYEYTITEYIPPNAEDNVLDGITYTTVPVRVSVTVTDMKDGTLKVSDPVYDPENGTFVNTYEADGQIEFYGQKTLENQQLTTMQFYYDVFEGDTKVAQGYNDAAGVIHFDVIRYVYDPESEIDDRGTHTYSISERIPEDAVNADGTAYKDADDEAKAKGGFVRNGITYDSTVRTVVVEVTDVDGVLKAEIVEDDSDPIAFVNTYEAKGEFTPEVSKELIGIVYGETTPETFTFELVNSSGTVIDTASTTEDEPKATFSTITYTQDQDGKTYTYTIREVPPTEAEKQADGTYVYKGVAYDAHTITATVTIKDNKDGTLTVTPTYSEAEATFTNTYTAEGTAEVEVTKALLGKDLEAGAFEFSIEAVTDGAPLPAETVASNDAEGNVTFGDIVFTSTHMDGRNTAEFVYEITELVPNAADDSNTLDGITYSTETVTVTITMKDNKDGTLSADSIVYDPAEKTFTNEYTARGSFTPEGFKTLENKTLTDGAFTYEVYEGEGSEPVAVGTNDATGKITFETIEYVYDVTDPENAIDDTGTHTYTVKEVIPDDAEETDAGFVKDGVIYDSTVYTVTVEVSDNGNGTLSAVRTDNGLPVLPFTNTYTAAGETEFHGRKLIENREFKEGDSWTFTVRCDDAEAPLPENNPITIQPTEGTAADLEFGKITYTLDDLKDEDGKLLTEKEFVYTITETGSGEGVTNDSRTHIVTVIVSDDEKNGILTVTKSGDEAELIEFVNPYDAQGEYPLSAVKTLKNRDFREGDSWIFTVSSDDENAPLPETPSVTITPTEGRSASVDFGKICFTLEDAGRTYTYTVTESGTVAGVTNDTEKKIVLTVTDDKSGTLVVTKDAEQSDELVFGNEYNAEGEIVLDGVKMIENREFEEGDTATFTITAVTEGAPLPENTSVEVTMTEGDSVTFTFDPITYRVTDLGGAAEKTFVYEIRETAYNMRATAGDSSVRTVKVRVSDNYDGTLAAVRTEDSDKVEFVNTFVEVKVNKYDNEGSEVDGAVLTLYEQGSGEPLDSWTSRAGAIHDFSDVLQSGRSYVIVETETPDGYYPTEDIRFTVTEDGQLEGLDLEKDKDGVYKVVDARIVITVDKVDNSDKPLKGAVLAVKDADGNVVDQWTTDGRIHVIQNLKADSTYTLTELKVPEGYTKAADITFSTGSKPTAQALKMVDKKTVVPDTSDDSRTLLWGTMTVMSLLLAIAAAALRKRDLKGF